MSVEIEPFELSFRRPFTVEVSQLLKIKNPNTSPVAFKVKTTAPKQYCVRPNSGRIEPGQDVEVTVLLQAMKAEPAPDAKCRDKFLVQSALITGDKEFASIASVLETTDKSLMQEKKIRVTWLQADEGSQDAGPVAATPKRESLLNGNEATPDVSRAFSSPSDDNASNAPPPYEDEKPTEAEHAESAVAQAKSNVAATAKMTYDQLKTLLDKTQAELVVLKQEGSLRLRKAAGDPDKPAKEQMVTAVRQGVQGVPVQTVAILCLVSFLLAYFFF